jgi:lysozyme
MNKADKIADLKARNLTWDIPWEAVALIASWEDCKLKAYLCPAGVPTIGWGETEGVRMGDQWTKENADLRFNYEVNRYTQQVRNNLTRYATPEQLGAMVSLAYNIGLGGFRRSSVLRAHNMGDNAAAARAFALWNKATVQGQKVELRGLTARRAAEAALYLREDEYPFSEPSVQAVDEESSLVKSPISLAGASSVAVGGTALATELLGDSLPIVQQAQQIAATLNINPVLVLGVVVLAAGWLSVKWRKKQREGGWA